VALVALLLACATIVGHVRWNEGANYSLVLAFHAGTNNLDPWHEMTGDIAYYNGHFRSVKAPGLAAAALPAYTVVHAVAPHAGDRSIVWALNLLVKLPLTLLLLLLVYRFGERIEPRTGLLAAFALGACTLVLPFSTLFFSHVAATATGFAAFVLLFDEPAGESSDRRIALAGLVAALTVILEYPSAIVAVALALYAIRRGPRARRLLAYTAGGLVGIAPLLAYNWWTFGSPVQLSYHYAVESGGVTDHDVVGAHARGLFGVTQPSLRVIAELLLQNRGLLVTTPIVVAGIAGAVLLARRGMRAEGCRSRSPRSGSHTAAHAGRL
jgi:hypothetical protein